MRRRWRWLLWSTGILLCASFALILTVLYSDWALERAIAWFAPDTLSVASVDGDVSGPLSLTGVVYEDETVRIALDRLDLRWSPWTLLSGLLHVRDLEIGRIDVEPKPGPTESPSEKPLALPPTLDFGLDVRVDRLAVASLTLGSGEDATRLDRLAFSGELTGGRAEIGRLRADLQDYGLSLVGYVDSESAYDHQLLARMLEPERPPIEAGLEGNLAATTLQLDAPGHDADMTFSVENLLDAPSWKLAATAGDLTRFAPLTDLAIQGEGSSDEASLTGRLNLDGREIRLQSAELRREDAVWLLEPLIVSLPGDDLSANLTGSIGDPADGSPLDLELRLSYPPRAADATLGVIGSLEDYQVAGEFTLDEGEVRGTLGGSGGLDQLALRELRVTAFEGVAELAAEASWGNESAWSVNGTLRDFDPSALAAQWPGSLNGRLQARGQGTEFEATLQDLGGNLRNRPVAGEVTARRLADAPLDVAARLQSGQSRLNLDAEWGDGLAATVALDVVDAGDFYPGAAGRAEGELTLGWANDRLRADGKLSAADLRWQDYSLATLDVVADQDGRRSEIEITGAALSLGGQSLSKVSGRFLGQLESHELKLASTADAGSLEVAVTGRFRDERYAATIDDLWLEQPETGRWTLTNPGNLRVDAGGAIELDPICLRRDQSELCAGLDWGDDIGRAVQVRANDVDLGLLEPLLANALDETVTIDGAVSGRVRLESAGARWSLIDVRVDATPTQIDITGYDEPILVSRTELTAVGDEYALELGGGARIDDSEVTLEGGWDQPFGGGALDLRVLGEIPDFGSYEALIPQLAELKGSARFDLRLAGPTDQLEPNGSLNLQQFGARVIPLGVLLAEGNIAATWRGGGVAQVRGSVRSGDGTLAIDGTLGLVDGKPRADLALTGDDVRAVNLPTVRVTVSPDLRAAVGDGGARITGSVDVPSATIQLADFGQGVTPSSDVVVVDDPVESQESGLPIFSEIDLRLGEDVRLQGFGLDAAVAGQLHISETPNRPTLGRGELRVTGEYAAYGQQLEIERGRIIFSDTPLDNPALDVRAVRKLETVEAGVQVRGRVTDPTLEIYSVPAMEESEALSWLVLGRPLRNAAGDDADLLGAAALSLGLKGGNKIASALGSNLGFAELGFSSNADLGGAAFSLGRYLSPKLYISYSVGLLESLDLVQLQYTLNDKWAVESQVGEEAKGILKYRIEKGR